jgi:hypothetical protein
MLSKIKKVMKKIFQLSFVLVAGLAPWVNTKQNTVTKAFECELNKFFNDTFW